MCTPLIVGVDLGAWCSLGHSYNAPHKAKISIGVRCSQGSIGGNLDVSQVTENAERHTFKAPCCCFENAPYTELTFV